MTKINDRTLSEMESVGGGSNVVRFLRFTPQAIAGGIIYDAVKSGVEAMHDYYSDPANQGIGGVTYENSGALGPNR